MGTTFLNFVGGLEIWPQSVYIQRPTAVLLQAVTSQRGDTLVGVVVDLDRHQLGLISQRRLMCEWE